MLSSSKSKSKSAIEDVKTFRSPRTQSDQVNIPQDPHYSGGGAE